MKFLPLPSNLLQMEDFNMKETKKSTAVKAQRTLTEQKIINGTIADGDDIVKAIYDANIYPAKPAYD